MQMVRRFGAVLLVSGDTVVALVADSTKETNPHEQAYLDGIFDLRAQCNDPGQLSRGRQREGG